MPVHTDDNKYYDVDTIITSFFTKYKEDMLNILPIKLKKFTGEDRDYLMRINGNGQDRLSRVGKIRSYIRHYVIPEKK
jgi:hypothetical protein